MAIFLIEQFKECKRKVEKVLTEYPETRDSDKLLQLAIWRMFDKMPDKFTYNAFKVWYLTKATNAETIRRDRQILQKMYPHLRGTRYGQKQQAGKQVKMNIAEV